MQRFYKSLLPLIVFGLSGLVVKAQVADTSINSLDPELLNIFNQKNAQKYKVADIKVTGNKYFDQALLISVAGISVGDEITIPGGDNFSKAINKLWAQNYFSDVAIYITKLEGTNIYLEINVTERPRLSNYILKGVSKSEADDVGPKTGLIKGRVVTENMKRTAIDAINKFYFEKGFRNVKVNVEAKRDTGLENSVVLYLYINKGGKVKINQINFIDDTTVNALKLKKQMKGTKEMTRITLYPPKDSGGIANPTLYTFSDYLNDKGYLTFTKTRLILDPYIRLKFFTNANAGIFKI